MWKQIDNRFEYENDFEKLKWIWKTKMISKNENEFEKWKWTWKMNINLKN